MASTPSISRSAQIRYLTRLRVRRGIEHALISVQAGSTSINRNVNTWTQQHSTIASGDTDITTVASNSSRRIVQHGAYRQLVDWTGRHHATTTSQPGASTRHASGSSLLQGPVSYCVRVLVCRIPILHTAPFIWEPRPISAASYDRCASSARSWLRTA